MINNAAKVGPPRREMGYKCYHLAVIDIIVATDKKKPDAQASGFRNSMKKIKAMYWGKRNRSRRTYHFP